MGPPTYNICHDHERFSVQLFDFDQTRVYAGCWLKTPEQARQPPAIFNVWLAARAVRKAHDLHVLPKQAILDTDCAILVERINSNSKCRNENCISDINSNDQSSACDYCQNLNQLRRELDCYDGTSIVTRNKFKTFNAPLPDCQYKI